MRSRRILRFLAGAAAIALLALSAACVPATTLPDDCNAASVERQVTLSPDSLDPSTIAVCRGQRVTITVDVQADGELHFHGYEKQVPEQEVTSGESVTAAFVANAAGEFPIELHAPDGSTETQVGTLVVNEP